MKEVQIRPRTFIHGVIVKTKKDDSLFLEAGTKIYRVITKENEKNYFTHKGEKILDINFCKINKNLCLPACV